MRRLAALLPTTLVLVLLVAPAALAATGGPDYGEGLYGETNDRVITNAGFILLAAFPLFISLMSLLQWLLDRRKERRKAAAKARQARREWSESW
jgi:hypothetical protein